MITYNRFITCAAIHVYTKVTQRKIQNNWTSTIIFKMSIPQKDFTFKNYTVEKVSGKVLFIWYPPQTPTPIQTKNIFNI